MSIFQNSKWTNTKSNAQIVSIRKEGCAIRVRMNGPTIRVREAEIIDKEAADAIRSASCSINAVVLDFTDVAYLSSVGLGMCIDLRNVAEKSGKRAILIGLNRKLRELFKMMRVDRLFVLVHDDHELQKLLRQ